MAEEIEWLDEELTSLAADLTEKIKEITSSAGKKMAKTAREERVGAWVRGWVRGCERACLRTGGRAVGVGHRPDVVGDNRLLLAWRRGGDAGVAVAIRFGARACPSPDPYAVGSCSSPISSTAWLAPKMCWRPTVWNCAR
jgi:hypothetical protein